MRHNSSNSTARGQRPLRFWLSLGIFLAFAVYLLWAEHRVHFLQALPILILLAMFPVLIWMYRQEEQEIERQFSAEWRDYAARTPRFVPRLGMLAASGRRV